MGCRDDHLVGGARTVTATTLRDYVPADDTAARAIYEASFPPSLRAPWADLVDHRDDERLLILDDSAFGPAGMALVRRLGQTDMAFVRYLAVDPARRDRGLGTDLVTHLRHALRSDGVGALLLDVEEPIGEHAEQDRRRIAFYQRCGIDVLDVPDYAPPEHGETGEIVPLLLMGEILDGGQPLTGTRLRDAVRAVMTHRYGVQA